MCHRLLILSGVVAMVATGTGANLNPLSYEYKSIGEEGSNAEGVVVSKKKFTIPNLQCSGELNFPQDYHCKDSDGLLKQSSKVRVTVLDNKAPAKIIFANDRRSISIYRMGGCQEPALVELHTICDQVLKEGVQVDNKTKNK
ncbi:hypothetical protein O0L34_g3749 [Tuta absoluta]|nr:hypothetical protein O0L34_g3749 [Tuta absoluta]